MKSMNSENSVNSPRYRMPRTSAWNPEQAADFLRDQRQPLRLGIQTESGPLVVPLWFHFDGADFWCATQRDSLVARSLEQRPECGIDVSTNDIPYRGLRGRGRATCHSEHGAAVLDRLIERYLGAKETQLSRWLRSRSDAEVALRIEPKWLTAWDFSERMTQP